MSFSISLLPISEEEVKSVNCSANWFKAEGLKRYR